jgi:molecular chaperone GrpE
MDTSKTKGREPAAPAEEQMLTELTGEPDADAAAEGAAGPGPAEPIRDELAEVKEQMLRLRADFDNFRRRTLRDRDEHNRRATEKLLKELLPVLDHLELGVQQAHKHHVKHAFVEGFEAVVEQLRGVLARAGVEEIETDGQPFDPQMHECIAHAPSDKPENTIIAHSHRGFRLGKYVLRAPQVVVSSGAAAAGGSSPAPAGEP